MPLEHSPTRVGDHPSVRRASTVSEFCEENRISRTALYQHWKEGRGPRFGTARAA
jgi:hypothetical protein